VKQELRLIIEDHEKKNSGKRLSDERLVALLADRDIHIARRTVAKYRSELNIQSSFDR
jgi:RNA polymerase sigma-54 factor